MKMKKPEERIVFLLTTFYQELRIENYMRIPDDLYGIVRGNH